MVANFKKKRKSDPWKNILLHLGGIAVLIVCGFLIYANVRIYQKKAEYRAQVSNLQAQIKGIEESNDHLREGMKNSDNPEYIEKVAREELDLQQPGEKVVSFIMPKANDQKKQDNPANILTGWLSGTWSWLLKTF
jgi:cell division protein FtsB